MEREKASAQVARIVGSIERGEFPAPVRALYVFGSYARGAMSPGDLDLMIVHDPPPADLLKRIEDQIIEKYGEDSFYWPRSTSPKQRFEVMMRAAARRPGEKMDIFLATSIQELSELGTNVAKAHRVLIWSAEDRDWQEKLASIKPDPSAGSYERGYLLPIKRFRGNLRLMENVTELIKEDYLKLTRIDATAVQPDLNPVYEQWADLWVKHEVLGKESMKLLRHGMWWMQQQRGQRLQRPHLPESGNIMRSADGSYAVFFGNPPLYAVIQFVRGSGYNRICLIPHFKRGQPNELYVFERGKKTSLKNLEALLRKR